MAAPATWAPITALPAATGVLCSILSSNVTTSLSRARRLAGSGRDSVVFSRRPLPMLAQL
jgi:hypothetical protein